MTADPSPPHPGAAGAAPTNTLGLVGFIGSILALCTFGVLSPIPFFMSLFALRKEPRGLAIAGAVIGFVGSVVGVLVGFATVMAFLFVKEHGVTGVSMVAARLQIDQYQSLHHQLPDADEGSSLVAPLKDEWGHGLRYATDGETYTLKSAGADGKFDTPDDINESHPK